MKQTQAKVAQTVKITNKISFAEALKKASEVTKPKQMLGKKPVKTGKERRNRKKRTFLKEPSHQHKIKKETL